ncbi:hypothetical protein RU92_GL000677 [Lactococcus cremoris subsp. tructae]|uniref:Uncharacterized protein n=1 Tax=Lactococcus cremoris subsp. tructae TaxID=542833 RepID=A0A2A5SYL7_LACLC|nr:hypothetical protein RU92_GL000677 [Lactococcus cremoris subsp. tructae]
MLEKRRATLEPFYYLRDKKARYMKKLIEKMRLKADKTCISKRF